MILAGDIGGTKANLALFENDLKPTHMLTFQSGNYSDLRSLIKDYLQKCGNPSIKAACFALPGPVENGICKTTNLPWVVESSTVGKACDIPVVYLLNDLEANAYGIENLPPESLAILHPGEGSHKGNRAVVSPGTGLGEAGIYWDGSHYHPFACEGGHTDFAPCNELQTELYHYLQSKYGHVSYERVLSGPGLHNLFQFFVEAKGYQPSDELIQEMSEEDPGRVITRHMNTSEICGEVVDLFVQILGAEVGNCALKFMALGGVFLGGGIPPKILPKLKENRFLKGFHGKGRMYQLIKKIPVAVILDEKTALRGAACYGLLCTVH